MPVQVFIVIEIFISFYISKLVLFPIADIINRKKKKRIFRALFLILLIMLIVGNIFAPGITVIVEILLMFFGKFIVLPLLENYKCSIFKNSSSYDEYDEVSTNELAKIGFANSDLLLRAFNRQYIEIKNSICDFNYDRLVELCDLRRYFLYKKEMKLLEKVHDKNVLKDFQIEEAKIYDVYKDDKCIEVYLVLKASCIEFTVDCNNNVVRGNDKYKKSIMVEISFINKLNGNLIEKCPNCAAPLKKNSIESCSYCGTFLNYKVGDWLLSREHRVYEK